MLTIIVPGTEESELFDERTNTFIPVPATKTKELQLEHSLISISKWESKWCKPFFSKEKKTEEEIIDYIKCMTITPRVDDEVYGGLTRENVEAINKYLNAPMTASSVREDKNTKRGREQVTSELIYYWMISLNIPTEFERWHINRLLMLIRICNAKNANPKKKSRKELAADYAAINAANKKRFNTKG